MHTHINIETNNTTFTQLLKDNQAHKFESNSPLLYSFNKYLQGFQQPFAAFILFFQQPLLGIDYIDLYMKGILKPSLQTILVLSYHN